MLKRSSTILTVTHMQTETKLEEHTSQEPMRRHHVVKTFDRNAMECRHVVHMWCCCAAKVAFFMANEAPALLNAFKVPMCPVEAFLESAANESRSKVFIFSPHQASNRSHL